MKANWQTVLGGIALATTMAAAAPVYADDIGMWDMDKSGTLDYNEWNTGWGANSAWDENDDGVLSDREYGEGIFNTYDADDDNYWNNDEMMKFQDDAGDRGWLDV